MSEKVRALRGNADFTHGEPVESVIACLEDWLERAKSGELVGIAAATCHSDESYSWRLCGRYREVNLIGMLEVCKADITRDCLDE